MHSQLTNDQWNQWAGFCRESGRPVQLHVLKTAPARVRLWDNLSLPEQAALTILRLTALPGLMMILQGACLSQQEAIGEVRQLSALGLGIINAEGCLIRHFSDLARREVFFSLRAMGIPPERAVLKVVCPACVLEGED